jgi:hypothetical protein
MNRKTILPRILTCFALLMVNSAASAEDAKEQPPVTAIDPSRIDDIEGMGILDSQQHGSLGSKLWENSRRSEIVNYFHLLPGGTGSTAIRDVETRLLLTDAKTSDLENDIAIEAAQDLFTLRLKKLLDLGAYKQALEMYNLLDGQPYSPALAEQGILSMFYSGEKSLGCLEIETTNDKPATTFWRHVEAYCATTLSEVPDDAAAKMIAESSLTVLKSLVSQKDYSFSYEPETFASLTKVEQALLSAENKISLPQNSETIISNIPANHVEILLAKDDLDNKDRFLLTAKSVELGLLPPSDLKKLYQTMVEPAAGTGFESAPSWQKPALLYHSLQDADTMEEKWALVKSHLSLTEKYGYGSLSPAAQEIAELSPETVSLEDLNKVYRIFSAARLPIPAHWSQKAFDLEAEKHDPDTLLRLASVAFLAAPQQHDKDYAQLYDKISKKALPATNELSYVMKNFDNLPGFADNELEIYDNVFYLTSGKDYVMPSLSVMDRFGFEKKSERKAETILLSTIALQEQEVHKVYPGLLREVVNSLNNVGLTNVSRELLSEAFLGGMNIKGEN